MVIKSLCLPSGGLNVMLTLGALEALFEKMIQLKNINIFAGTSSGSAVAALLAMGFTPYEILWELCKSETQIDYDLIGFIKQQSTLSSLDPYRAKLNEIILTKYKTVPSLEELYKITGNQLFIGVYCVSTESKVFFNHETHPNLSVLDAIVASSSVPLIFPPVIIDDLYYVDGGVIEGLPIEPLLKILYPSEMCVIEYAYQTWDKNASTLQNFFYFLYLPLSTARKARLEPLKGDLGMHIVLPSKYASIVSERSITTRDKIAGFVSGYDEASSIIGQGKF